MKLVLDTNIVLDLFVFADKAAHALREALSANHVAWVATAEMREELVRVLAYGLIEGRMRAAGISPHDVLQAFDRHASLVEVPAGSPLKCRDRDDQKFVDLAVAHGAIILSKDREILALRRKLPVARSLVKTTAERYEPAP